jgi:DNA-binding GntR family transcriptional regulator
MLERKIQPIEDSTKTISNIAQERIRAAILEGVLPPGSRIDQNQLARDLNTSLVPVREALKKLESEGFVQIVPRRGAFVTEVSMQDLEDLYSARVIVEGAAGYNAAALLTDDDLRRLQQIHTQMNEALGHEDYDRFTRLNRQFHFVIFDRVGSTYLSKMIAGLWELAERYRYRSALFKERAELIQLEHKAMLDACERHDGEALRSAIVRHAEETMNGIRAFVTRTTKE